MDSIPRIIWQTYSSREMLPDEAHSCLDSWKVHNPSWGFQFRNDTEIERDIERFFPEYLQTFRSLPHGAMKADFWRYAIIHQMGGMYADIDTSCNSPIESWMRPGFSDHLYVACENHHPFFCQWAFASPAGHPALLCALEKIRQRIGADGGVDCSRPDYVHYYTGPGLWTDALKEYIGSDQSTVDLHASQAEFASRKLIIFPEGSFTWGMISHHNASLSWPESHYQSWQRQRKDQPK